MSTISFTQLAEQFAKAAAAFDELESLKRKYNYIKEVNEAIDKDRFERMQKICDLEDNCKILNAEIVELKNSNIQLIKEHYQIDNQLYKNVRLEEKCKQLHDEVVSLKRNFNVNIEVAKLKSQIETLSNDLARCVEQRDDLEKEVEIVKAKHRKLITAMHGFLWKLKIPKPPTYDRVSWS